jgi:cation transport ATPase
MAFVGNLLTAVWRRKTTIIAALAITAIVAHLLLRFAFRTSLEMSQLPLLAILIVGGAPLVFDLLKKLRRREFGSDLLGGISVVTSVVMGEYLAGSIIVLMLSGGAAMTIRTTQLAADSRYAKIMAVMRESEQTRPRLRRLGDQLGAISQEIIDVLAVLDAPRAAFPPKLMSDLSKYPPPSQ